jgi:hypothetical protein
MQQEIIKELKEQALRLAGTFTDDRVKPEDTLYWRAAEVIERLTDRNLWSGGSPE